MSFEEQIMSNNKCPSIFSPQMEAIVFIIFQVVLATRAVLRFGEYIYVIYRAGGPYGKKLCPRS